MKHLTQITITVLGLASFISLVYAADLVISETEQLNKSLAKWESVRKACDGNYSYTHNWSSAFGFANRTTITVKGNKVVERKYEEFGRPEPVAPGEKPMPPKPKWIEIGKDLGSHKSEGIAVRTMDELYSEAKKIMIMNAPEKHMRNIGFDKTGLLMFCYTRDTRIQDDGPIIGIPMIQIQIPTTSPE